MRVESFSTKDIYACHKKALSLSAFLYRLNTHSLTNFYDPYTLETGQNDPMMEAGQDC